jgi:hypothetical protein
MGLKSIVKALADGWKQKDRVIAEVHSQGFSISPFVPGAIVPQVNDSDDDEPWGEIILGSDAKEIAENARRLLAPRDPKPQF